MTTGSQARTDMKHIVIATETFTPDINGVANTLQHLCHALNWHLQIEQFEQLVLNTPPKAKYHAVNQSLSLF